MDMKCDLVSFPKFAALPTEVRLLIWQHALPAPRIIHISENSIDDAEEQGMAEEDALLSGLFVPSRLFSAQDFALERSCVEAREMVASRYKPIAFAPTGPQQRIWNGFAYTDYTFKMVETQSPIAWPENIRVDLSRDILFFEVADAIYFQDIVNMAGLDWPRIFTETRRLAISGKAFTTPRPAEEKDNIRANSMVDEEYEMFDSTEANMLQAAELLERFKNVREVFLPLCWSCFFTMDIGSRLYPSMKMEWTDWGLTECPLSSLPTSSPAIDPADRMRADPTMYMNLDPRFDGRIVQLRAFRLRGIIQALEEEKKRGRLKQVEKFSVAQVVYMLTKSRSSTPGWYLDCGPTGEYTNRRVRAADQNINFL